MYKIMTFEEAGEFVYKALKLNENCIREDLIFYSDFDKEDLSKNAEVTNAIGVKTTRIFDETCLLAIGVYGEEFTEVYNLGGSYSRKEVVSFIANWFRSMVLQLNNTEVVIRIPDEEEMKEWMLRATEVQAILENDLYEGKAEETTMMEELDLLEGRISLYEELCFPAAGANSSSQASANARTFCVTS